MNVSTADERSQLNPYLSRRRNTTGSISLKKILDLNNDSSGPAFKLSSFSALNQSTEKISPESKAFSSPSPLGHERVRLDLFQFIEDSDLLRVKMLIESNKTLVHS